MSFRHLTVKKETSEALWSFKNSRL